jgi:hypothetical protein
MLEAGLAISGLAGPEQRRAVASRRSSALFWLIAER